MVKAPIVFMIALSVHMFTVTAFHEGATFNVEDTSAPPSASIPPS